MPLFGEMYHNQRLEKLMADFIQTLDSKIAIDAKSESALEYKPRFADDRLQQALKRAGAVQIVGPKWCGKTTTALQQAKSVVYFQNPDTRAANLRIANEKPSLLLQGNKPLLLDEWQDAPVMWDAVRFAVDSATQVGQYILTGSTVINSKEIMHSGAGRFAKLRMRTMSLAESGESNGTVSLAGIAASEEASGTSALTLEDLAYLLVRGGWPHSLSLPKDAAWQVASDYTEAIVNIDSSKVDGIEKNPNRVRLLMRSLARNESSEARIATLRSDMAAESDALAANTVAQYLTALRSLYVLEEQEAWAPAVRSKTAQRTSPIRRYCDPSIGCALLGLTPDKLLVDYNTFGLLFESLCIRDLRAYAEVLNASIFHYRDARGLECDAIIEFADGRWGAVEIKLQDSQLDKAVQTLMQIRDKVKSQHGGAAAFLMVITAKGYAYRRNDGIYVVPIGCLAP
jgi:predicted AAA+ superfamily ATPase